VKHCGDRVLGAQHGNLLHEYQGLQCASLDELDQIFQICVEQSLDDRHHCGQLLLLLHHDDWLDEYQKFCTQSY